MPDLDEVAAGDRPLDQQDQPRDEVLRDVLQPEADADEHDCRRGQERVEPNAERHHRHQRPDEDDDVASDLGQREAGSVRHFAARQHPRHGAAGEHGQEVRGHDDEEAHQQRRQGDRASGQMNQRIVRERF